MAIRSVVTRGYGNGTFNGTIALAVLRGYAAGAPVFTGTIPDISVTENTGTYTYDLSTYFAGATIYSISPAIEAGWTFNTTTAELVIDTDDTNAFGPYTVTGTNTGGSAVSNGFDVEVIEAAQVAQGGGGWAYAYEDELQRRKQKKRELEQLEEKADQISDKIDKELAKELRKQDRKKVRIEELRRLSTLAEEHKAELQKTISAKAIKAVESAIMMKTYSAMERMEREIARAREEEEFLILATSIILNS